MNNPDRPAHPLPAGAWDTHAHVFGPYERFPLAPDRAYEPPYGPFEDYIAMLDRVGFARGVLVHAGANGYDLSGTQDAIARGKGRVLGVAVVRSDATFADLEAVKAQGFSAVRFTEMGAAAGMRRPYTLIFDDLKRLAPALRDLGMHAQIWGRCELFVSEAPNLLNLGFPIVIDHLGTFDASRGVTDSSFQKFLGILASGQVWVKMTPIRNSKLAPTYDDVRPFQDAVLARAPDRALWGSDWPYIGLNPPPRVEKLIDLFDNWLNDDGLRQKVFVTNPAALFDQAR